MNTTGIEGTLEDESQFSKIWTTFPDQIPKMASFFAITILSGLWLIYLTFYNSRVFGWIISKYFGFKNQYVSFGSFSINVLGGKIMFRNLHYGCSDYTVTVNDGYLIFRWWLPHPIADEDHADGKLPRRKEKKTSRILIQLSGCDWNYFYNESVHGPQSEGNVEKAVTKTWDDIWDLCPHFEINVLYGRIIMGNKTLPYSIICNLSEGHFYYRKPNKKYRQILEGDARNFEVLFVPTTDYEGKRTDKPIPGTGKRNFSENDQNRLDYRVNEVYSICVSRKAAITYYVDLLPSDVHSDSQPLVAENPEWGVSMLLSNNTTINWGPWCDRQRASIWLFFNPISKDEWQPSAQPSLRQFKLDIEFSAKLDSKRSRQKSQKNQKLTNRLNLEFLGGDGTVKELNVQAGEGSRMESVTPYFPQEFDEDGKLFYMTQKISLQDAKVSFQSEPLKRFLEAKEITVFLETLTPTFFNRHQLWTFDVNIKESSLMFVWPIKQFMTDLINDWSPDKPLDLVDYVPVTYEFQIRFHQLEVLLPVNEYNYVDCNNPVPDLPGSSCKNNLLALAVPELEADFGLPFDSFAPPSVETVFNIKTRQGSIAIFIPSCSPAHHIQKASHKAQESFQKSLGQNRILVYDADYWRKITRGENGFVEIGSCNKLNLTFEYKWNCDYMPHPRYRKKANIKFDPTLSDADFLRARIVAEQIEPVAYGTLVPVLLNVKENVLGFWDQVTPFVPNNSFPNDEIVEINTNTVKVDPESPWIRPFRAFSVVVEVELRDLTARLPLPPNSALENGGPLVKLDFLIFELDKHYTSTRMQLTLSEIDVTFGHKWSDLHLSGLQYRGSSFFSAEGLPLTANTLEYAWMQEVEIGKITGELKVKDILNLGLWLDQVILCVVDKASELEPPRTLVIGDEMKYEKIKLTWLGIEFTAVSATAKAKATVGRSTVSVNNLRCDERGGFVDANLGAVAIQIAVKYDNQWLQVSLVQLPLTTVAIELGLVEAEFNEQDAWLRRHDRNKKRLDFLWNSDKGETVYETSRQESWGCGWFEPDENSPAEVMLDGLVKRGCSLLVDQMLIDLDKRFEKRPFNSRQTVTSLHSTGSISPDGPFGRTSFRNSVALLQPTESGDSGRLKSSSISRISNRSRDEYLGITGILKPRTPEPFPGDISTQENLNSEVISIKSFKSAKTTASSMTEKFHSAVGSSFGSTNTIDQFYSADEYDEFEDGTLGREEESSTTLGRNPSMNESVISNRTIERSERSDSRSSPTRSRTKRISRESTSQASSQRIRTESRCSRTSGVFRRRRPSNLPLHTIASPVQAEEDPEMYDKVLPILTEDMKIQEGDTGVCNGIIVKDAKRGVDFEPESPRVSQRVDPTDRNATKVNIALDSVSNTSAVDIFATPLCLGVVRRVLEDVEDVVQRLHYSTITTILMSKVVAEHVEREEDLPEDRKTRLILNFKIKNVKLGLCQVAQNINENGIVPQKSVPCTTLLISWIEQVELTIDLKQNKNAIASGSFRRLHLQFRANSSDGNEPEGTNVVCLQETANRPQKLVSVAFKCENDWGWIMAEAGIDGIKLKGERLAGKAQMNMNVEKIWFLAAAPSSLSRATRQWSLLSTASHGASTWVERLEDISSEVNHIREHIINQRCKVIVAPLAHRVAMTGSTDKATEYDYNIRKLIENMNNIPVEGGSDLPLSKTAKALRKNIAFCAAVSNVALLSSPEFVKEIFRDGSEEAEYFIEIKQDAQNGTNLKIPKSQTLKRALLIVCHKWQKEMAAYSKEMGWEESANDIFDGARMPSRLSRDADHKWSPTKVQTFNHNYSLPREGVKSIIQMKPILDYCHVPVENEPETFTSLYKEEIHQLKVTANLSSFQVFIKETEKRRARRFRSIDIANQPVLKLDQIKVTGQLDIPNTEIEKLQNIPPKVVISLDITEISQRLDMSLVRLIVQVNGVVDNIARAKMDHRIGRMEERCNDDNLHYASSYTSSDDSIDLHQEIDHHEQLNEATSSTREGDPAWLVFVYNDGLNVPTDDTVEVETEQQSTTISRLARSTVVQARELHQPGGKFHSTSNDSDLDTETILKIDISFSIKTTRLSADVGGLSLSIQLNALDGSVNLEQLRYVQEVSFDADNKVQPLRLAPNMASLKLAVHVKLKSINIDFIEAHSSAVVLQVTVERSNFNASPNSKEGQKIIDVSAEVGKLNVKLPLRVRELHHVLVRTSRQFGQQLKTIDIAAPTVIDTPDFDVGPLVHDGATNSPPVGSESGSKTSRSTTLPFIFNVTFKGFFMKINLLQSVTANYEVGPIRGFGEWNPSPAKSSISSASQILMTSNLKVTEHKINITGDFKTADHAEKISQKIIFPSIEVDLDLKKDKFELLSGKCDIENFQQDLTTELFNILLSCVDELKSEINDILNKLKNEEAFPSLGFQGVATTPKEMTPASPMKYFFKVQMKGINIQASTPTGNIVKLDVPVISSTIANFDDETKTMTYVFPQADKLIINGDIELKLCLLCQTSAHDSMKKLASFDARLNIHNTNESAEDVLLATLKSPNVFIHSNAIDRAILVYLNYRSSYNVWKEEIEKSLNKSAIRAPKDGAVPLKASQPAKPPQAPSRLFLNLTVNDFKVKMPLIDLKNEVKTNHVLVLTFSHINVFGTIGELSVFKGKFNGFELLFDREGQPREVKMNCCEVKEGGIEIVSGTEHIDGGSVAGIWNLLVSWNMMGLDVKFDTQIGALFSRFGKTLTTFSDEVIVSEGSKALLKELRDKYNTGTKTLEDLKQLGATKSIIKDEEEALREIEGEYKKQYMLLKRRPAQEPDRVTDGEIELILNATLTIKTGKLECYPFDIVPTSKPKYDFVDERKRNSAISTDSSVTVFLLPALDVDLNYMSHVTGSNDGERRAKLYSNVIIGSMPKEMSISPLFLDYLSQTMDILDEMDVQPDDDDQNDLHDPTHQATQSFPVDVVVHAKVKPSTVLFSCQPKAKVECTLRVPLTNLVFSSAPSGTSKTGLNLAIQLSDFALRVNHPYENSSKGCFHLNLEGIYINILRQHVSENLLTISVISDIGQANINYDMRRLSEILGFPKAWYNRSITRRMFLGETGQKQPSKETAMNGWETAVRVSTVLRELRVDMNIGNVLGKTVWVTEQLAYHGAFDIRSSRNNDIKNVVSLAKTKIESRSGLLGGVISITGFNGACLWRERGKQDSAHEAKVTLDEVSIRLEYHSSVILLSKLTDAELIIIDGSILDGRTPRVKANLDMKWGEFDLLLCKSTSKNLIQGGRKVQDFIKQQINTGSEAFRSMFDQPANKQLLGPSVINEEDKYQRHWPPIFHNHKVDSFQLGGESRLRGNELSVVCFDGDFKADNWAVFSVHLPDISFSSDVYCAKEEDHDRLSCYIFQTFIFNLGRAIEHVPNFETDKLGAFVLHVSRNKARRPGAQADVRDWIQYAVPAINEAEPEKSRDHLHVIFTLPQTEVTLKTEQIQPLKLPAFPEESNVICVFVAEFHEQPLKVTMGTKEILFLTNFVTEYLREHKSVMTNQEIQVEEDEVEPIGNSNDPRAYTCRTWKLDPLTRFMYNNTVLECPGVDTIIQQLGFKHAKLTIPKWFQRGLLDKLDSTHAVLTARLLDVYKKIKPLPTAQSQ